MIYLQFLQEWVPTLLIAWVIICFAIFFEIRTSPTPSSGLTMYIPLVMTFIHLPGAALLLQEWYSYYPKSFTFNGFLLSVIGVAAYFLGILFFRFTYQSKPTKSSEVAPIDLQKLRKFGITIFFFGIVLSLASPLFSTYFTLLSALIGSCAQLCNVALCLVLYSFVAKRKLIPVWVYLLMFMLPFISVVFQGFLGLGVVALMFPVLFYLSRAKRSLYFIAVTPIIAYVGISLAISYFQGRTELRDAVWGGKDFSTRIDKTYEIFEKFEWFDPENREHLALVDARLNQNWLIGASMERVWLNQDVPEHGATIFAALVAWVPRAVWINKPTVAGSGDLVSRHTGFEFDKSTSVGVGNILELFINFGIYGVVIGMFLFGYLVKRMDTVCSEALNQGAVLRWMSIYFVTMPFLSPVGQFSEATSGAAAAFIVMLGVQYFVTMRKVEFS
jgi:hypothetical protein